MVETPKEKIFGVADVEMPVMAFSDDFFGSRPFRFFSFLPEPVASGGFVSSVAVLQGISNSENVRKLMHSAHLLFQKHSPVSKKYEKLESPC